jgi:hypothetical protein
MNQVMPIRNEIRGLLPIWAGVVIAMSWQLFSGMERRGDLPTFSGILAFGLGLPILALLPFAAEFHYGTFSVLLAQPIERKKIWKRKTFVAAAAVISAALPFGLAWWKAGGDALAITAIWTLVSICTGAFWTLRARSLVGAISESMVQVAGFIVVYLAAAFGLGYPTSTRTIVALSIIYSAGMLLLGHRRLLRFQATDSAASNTLVVKQPRGLDRLIPMPSVRKSGATLNLIGKELSLLWHVIPLTLLAVAILISLTVLRYSVDQTAPIVGFLSRWPQVGVGVVVVHGMLVCILAGLLPVGLEREAGTLTWHLMLPISARRQWAVKLITAVAVTVVCSTFIALLAALLLGAPFISLIEPPFGGVLVAWLIGLAVGAVALFWCATASRGPIQAVMWTMPFGAALLLAAAVGSLIGRRTGTLLPSPLHPLLLTDSARLWISHYGSSKVVPLLLLAPAFIATIEQSYRLFRQEVRGPLQILKRLLVPAAAALIGGFVAVAPEVLTWSASGSPTAIFAETATAVRTYRIDVEKLKENGRLEIPIEALAKAKPLTDSTKRWLGNTAVVITSTKPASAGNRMPNHPAGYFITVRVGNRVECSFDEHPAHSAFHSCVAIP